MTGRQPAMAAEPKNQIAHDLEGVPLDQLFEEAMRFGEISLFQRDTGFSFWIEFHTTTGCMLKAHSGHGHGTISSAIIAAINKAREIKGQFR